jgi:hypothetical protein
MRTYRLLVVLAVAGALAMATVGTSYGAFVANPPEAQSFTSATLAPATGLARTCSLLLGIGTVNLSWTATTSTFATGYAVYRSQNGGAYSLLANVGGRATTVYVDHLLLNLGTLSYRVVAVAALSQTTWASVNSAAVAC